MAAAPNLPAPMPTSQSAGLSEAARIANTFIAPSKTFADLRRSASWWAPFLLLSVLSLGLFYVIDQKIGYHKVVQNQIDASPSATRRIEQLPADQREQAIARQANGTKYFLYGYPAIILLWNLLIAAVLFGTFKLAAGAADLKFKTAYAIVMYASLPLALKSILAMVSVGAGADPDSFNLQNPVATNPGYFLTQANSPFLYSVATAVDVFMIWTLILTAIGFSFGKVKFSTALAIVFGWYVLFAVGGGALGAAFS